MSVKISNLFDNSNIRQIDSKGSFVVLEHEKDLSTNYMKAQSEYFASQMGIHKRQLICQLSDSGVTVQLDIVKNYIDERFRQYLDKIEIKSKISIDVDKPKKQTYVLHYRK